MVVTKFHGMFLPVTLVGDFKLNVYKYVYIYIDLQDDTMKYNLICIHTYIYICIKYDYINICG